MRFLIFLVIINFLLAHILLRAIPQVVGVIFCFLACKKFKQIIIGSKCTNSSAGFMTTTGFFLLSRTIKIAFSYFSRNYYFSTCRFSFTSNSTGGICVLQKVEADNHWLTRFPAQCTNSSAGFMTTTRLPSSEGGGSTSPAEEKLIRDWSSFIF